MDHLKQMGFGPCVLYTLKQIKDAPLTLLKQVWKAKPASIVIYGSSSEQILFGDVLKLLSYAVRSPKRIVVEDGKIRGKVCLAEVLLGVFRVVWASLLGFIYTGMTGILALVYVLFPQHQRIKPNQEKRILYLKSDLWVGVHVGGSIGHVAGVIHAFHRLGHSVTLLTFEKNPVMDPEISQIRIDPMTALGVPYETNLPRASSKLYKQAISYIQKKRPDVIYQRYSINDLAGIRLARKYKIPLILEYNGSEAWGHQHWDKPLLFQRLTLLVERANLRNADLVVTVSQVLRQEVLDQGVSEERVLFSPNCVDPEQFNPGRFKDVDKAEVRSRGRIPLDAFLCTFVGTFGRWHGTEVLAKAIAYLIDTFPGWCERQKVHFLFVGDGPMAPMAQRILQPYAGSSCFTFYGVSPQSETPKILAASDLFVSPHVPNPDGTPFFGSPTKLFEYMAMGKPIIASDLDQIGAICRGWRPGTPIPDPEQKSKFAILVRPGNPVDLARGIREVVDLPTAERDRIGYEARRTILSAFSWEHHVTIILNRFESLAAG